MKSLFTRLICFLLIVPFSIQSQVDTLAQTPAGNDITLKVLMWNILGKRNLETYFNVNGTTGRDRMIEIIKESEADIVCMTETYGSAVDISNATGFEYWTPDPTANLTIFSRYPLENAGIVPGMSLYSFIRGTVVLPSGQKVKIYNIWLTSEGRGINKIYDMSISDQDFNVGDDNRADQLLGLINHSELKQDLINKDETPVIVAGDFNCVSHLDYTQATKSAGFNFGRVLNCRASQDMQNSGFTDTYRHLHPNITEQTLGHTWETWKTSYPLFARIDYIYSAGALMIPQESETMVYHKSNTTEHWPYWPSDHGAVMTTFTIKSDLDPEKPVADFVSNTDCGSGSIGPGNSIQFTDRSENSPTSYNWYFEGGTPTTSSTQNPNVQYNTIGSFDVQLIVSNSEGSDTLFKADLVEVTNGSGPQDAYVSINFENGIEDLSYNNFNLTPTSVNVESSDKFSTVTNNYGVFTSTSGIEIFNGNLSNCLPSDEFTASCLVYKKGTENYATYIGNFQDNGAMESGMVLGNMGQKFSIGLCTNDDPTISYLSAPNNYNLNQWYHIAVTYDGSTLKMFIDGELAIENNQEGGDVIWPTQSWFTAGRYKDDNEDFGMDGYLDEINLSTKALSDTEIQDLYNTLKGTVSISEVDQNNGLTAYFANDNLIVNNSHSFTSLKLFSISGELIIDSKDKAYELTTKALPTGIYVLIGQHQSGKIYTKRIAK